MKCDMCYDRTSVGRSQCARRSVPARRSSLAPARKSKNCARAHSPVNTFQFGAQTIHTKVWMMTPKAQPVNLVDVTGALELAPTAQAAENDPMLANLYVEQVLSVGESCSTLWTNLDRRLRTMDRAARRPAARKPTALAPGLSRSTGRRINISSAASLSNFCCSPVAPLPPDNFGFWCSGSGNAGKRRLPDQEIAQVERHSGWRLETVSISPGQPSPAARARR